MSEKLVPALGAGLEIETNTESAILRSFLEDNWPATVLGGYPNLPLKTEIDWQADPNRIIKPIIIRTYTVFSNIVEKDIGANIFSYNCPIAIDIYVRDLKASSERRDPTMLVAIETYIRDLISTNRLALRSKGIHSMEIDQITYVDEPPDDEEDVVWYHLVVQVRMHWHMNRVIG